MPDTINIDYRMWKYIKPEFCLCAKSTSPFFLNFNDISVLTQRLHPRVWIVNGLVVQIVHYANYNSITKTYSVPVVREQWYWILDATDDTVISREISIQGYADIENENKLISRKTNNIKFYNSYNMKVQELRRRRENIIYDLKDSIIRSLTDSGSTIDVVNVIMNTDILMKSISDEIHSFIYSGNTELSSIIENYDEDSLRKRFTWVESLIDIYGYGKLPIWEAIRNLVLNKTGDVLKNFDYNLLNNV